MHVCAIASVLNVCTDNSKFPEVIECDHAGLQLLLIVIHRSYPSGAACLAHDSLYVHTSDHQMKHSCL